MADMGRNFNLFGAVLRGFSTYKYKQCLVLLVLLCFSVSDLLAMDWQVNPSAGFEVSYTDNLYLSDDKQDDTIFRLSPAINLTGSGKRLWLNLSYTLNATSYSSSASDDKLTNNLSSDANVVFLEKFLFLDLSANVRQRSISNDAPIDPQQLSITENNSEVLTTQVSPYIDTLLGNYVHLMMKYSYTNTSYKESSVESADSEAGVALVSISSASNGRINWSANYSIKDTRYADSRDDVKFEQINGVLTISPSASWEVITSVGYEINDYGTTEDTERETYGLGLQWRPSGSTRFKIMSQSRYSGDSVTVELEHQQGRTGYAFNYMEALTVDALAEAGQGSSFETMNLGSVSNGAFLHKRGALTVTRDFMRSNLSLSAQSDEREYQNSRLEERTVAAHVQWSRRLSPRTDLSVGLNWSQTDGVDSDRGGESIGGRVGLNHRFGRRTTATLEYDNINRSSSGSSAEYERNLVTAGVRIAF